MARAVVVASQDAGELSEAFEERFEALIPRLAAVCRAVVGPDESADLVHETYLRARQRLHQLRDPTLLEPWIFRIALNEAKGLRRKRLREAPIDDQMVIRRTRSADLGLRDLVEHLPIKERLVIVLHYAYGYRLNEIARLMGTSEINTRTLAFRARRRLRALLVEGST